MLHETPSQTAGPYVHIGLIPDQAGFHIFDRPLGARIDGEGTRIRIEGRVLDGVGALVRDALVELWQCDAGGRYDTPGFRGFARAGTDFETGVYAFDTVMPGAGYVSLWIVARGINIGLQTRMYVDRDAMDAVLAVVDPARRATLFATETTPGVFTFDIRLQGEQETVFFDI